LQTLSRAGLLLLALSLAADAGWLKDRLGARLSKAPAPELSATVKALQVGEVTRYYTLHIPKSYDPKKATPLVLAFHGGTGDMSIQANDKYYGLISKSEQAGFIAVFPNGHSKFRSGKIATWNAGKCCGSARDEKSDDVGFVRSLVESLVKDYTIDRQRIYAIGMSNGGMMSYRLACELSDVVKGIAAVAGTDNTLECAPKNPVSILHIHARDDDHVMYEGGAGKNAFNNRTQITEFVSVPETIAMWVKHNGCKAPAKKVSAYCEIYSDCKGGVSVELCVTPDGKHSWPGGSKPRGGAGSAALKANDVIWDFFNSLR
jgi:polyhydroxybutyrate depolymerase